jgi:hypothetical protein
LQVAAKVFDIPRTDGNRAIIVEAEKTLKLDHPCLVQGIELILPKRDEDQSVIVMELMEDSLNHVRLDATDKCNAVMSIVKGGLYLHEECGLIHGDIKPQNLLVSRERGVKYSDFGSSQYEATLTRTKLALTFSYTAPELCQGSPPSFKTDVYSIGIVLHELVTGRPVHDPSTPMMQLMLNIAQGTLPELPAGTHPVLVTMIKRCCSVDPAGRPTLHEVCGEFAKVNWLLFNGADATKVNAFLASLPPDAGLRKELVTRLAASEQRSAELKGKAQQLEQQFEQEKKQLEQQIAQLQQQMASAKQRLGEELAQLKQQMAEEAQMTQELKRQLGQASPAHGLGASGRPAGVVGRRPARGAAKPPRDFARRPLRRGDEGPPARGSGGRPASGVPLRPPDGGERRRLKGVTGMVFDSGSSSNDSDS